MWTNPRYLRIRSHLLKKSLMENFIFCAGTFLQTGTGFIQTMHENWMFCAIFNLKLIAIFKMQHWPFAVDFDLLTVIWVRRGEGVGG